MFANVVLQFFFLLIVIQLGYVFFCFRRVLGLPFKDKLVDINYRKPISVIICAHNEARNLYKNLSSILKQEYLNIQGKPLFEVIVVNDRSSDSTLKVLERYKDHFNNIVVVNIKESELNGISGKKNALKNGVQAAKNDFIVFTDADCKPTSYSWLEKMVQPLHNDKEIVAGYSGFYKTNSLLNAFMRWETMHTFIKFASFSMAGIPYMGTGRNLACTKKLFQSVENTEVWNKTPYGDDDLLVNLGGTRINTTIVCHKDAFTFSEAKQSFKEYLFQKQRHLSTGKLYNIPTKVLLGLYAFSHALLWVLFFVLLFFNWEIALFLMLMRCTTYWVIWFLMAVKLNEERQYYLFPLFDCCWMVYNFVFSPYIFWKTKKTWK